MSTQASQQQSNIQSNSNLQQLLCDELLFKTDCSNSEQSFIF